VTALTTSGITYEVSVAFTTDLLSIPGAWTDISDFVRSVSTRRGRNHELGRMQAGEATLTLDNRDRRFDPTFTSSPYFPNVIPMRQIRIRATYLAVTYDVFYGFIEDWGQTWPSPAANAVGDAEISLHAVDAFKVLSLFDMKPYSSAVLEDEPVGYWRLRELTGTTALNEGSASTANGTYTNGPTLGVAGPLFGGLTATDFDGTNDFVTMGIPAAFNIIGSLTVEAWIRGDSFASEKTIIHAGDPYLFGVDSTAHLFFQNATALGSTRITATSTISTGAWHHVAATRDLETREVDLYVDGVLVKSATYPASVSNTTFDNLSVSVSAGSPFDGRIAQVAIYDRALTADRLLAHFASNFDTFPQEMSGAHISGVLDSVGWPGGKRAIDTGMSTIAEFGPEGSALDAIQQVAEDTEHGLIMASGDGTITFSDRSDAEKNVTAVATFGDSTGEMKYHDLELSYDDQDLWTEVVVAGADGTTVVASDAAAAVTYGTRSLSVSTKAALTNELSDQANGLLARYKAPAVRPRELVLFGTAGIPQQLGRVIGDRVTIKRRPPGGGTLTTDAIVEGISHDTKADGWLKTTFALAPADAVTFWILADATFGILDSTTRLGW
jgi:hypothetical protein